MTSLVHVSYLQAILLGLLQGLTEFLPVSSTAHMLIAPQLLGWHDPKSAFSAIAQLGPIVAIIAYFRADLARYFQGIVRTKSPLNIPRDDVDARLGWFVLIGTIPLAVFGLLLEKRIDNDFRSLYVTAFSLIALALVLLMAERSVKHNRPLESLTFPQSLIIGLAQVLALVPGASRSGVTITAGLFQGLDRESAARFSFLLSIPAITLAGLYKTFKVLRSPDFGSVAGPYFLAAIVAGVFAYVVIRWFLGYMKEHNTSVFIVYRIALGVLLFILLRAGILHTPAPETTTTRAVATRSVNGANRQAG